MNLPLSLVIRDRYSKEQLPPFSAGEVDESLPKATFDLIAVIVNCMSDNFKQSAPLFVRAGRVPPISEASVVEPPKNSNSEPLGY